MKKEQLNELLYQALETEAGGVQVYETAIRCAINADLKEEWKQYLAQTRTHEQIMRGLLEKMGLDSAIDTPGRQIVRHKGESLVDAMKMALKAGGSASGAVGRRGMCRHGRNQGSSKLGTNRTGRRAPSRLGRRRPERGLRTN